MDLVVKGRGGKVPGPTRTYVERKLAHLARVDPRLGWAEVELIRETRGRIGGGHRVEASCRSGRKVFRASASASSPEAAVDRMMERLERQIIQEHERHRAKMLEGANRVKSGRMPTPSEPPGRAR
jgi:ribosomal subunit interface protein